jgi:hypothetical protein
MRAARLKIPKALLRARGYTGRPVTDFRDRTNERIPVTVSLSHTLGDNTEILCTDSESLLYSTSSNYRIIPHCAVYR